MNTPSPHHAPYVPAPKPAPATAQPQPAAPALNAPLPKSRLADSRSTRDTSNVPQADSLFFEQLLTAPPSTGQDDQSDARGSTSTYSMFAPLDEVPTQLIEELALQLPSQGNRPFSATLLMPALGKVQIRANKRDSHWAIELGFERRDVLARVARHHQTCEDALAQALGRDVQLSLQTAGDA